MYFFFFGHLKMLADYIILRKALQFVPVHLIRFTHNILNSLQRQYTLCSCFFNLPNPHNFIEKKTHLKTISHNATWTHLLRFPTTHNPTAIPAHVCISGTRIVIDAPVAHVGVVDALDARGETVALVEIKVGGDYFLLALGGNG